MINRPHPQPLTLPHQIPPNTPKSQNTQHLALRIPPQRHRRLSPPLPAPQSLHGRVEPPQRAQDEEERRIGRGVVDGCRRVGDEERRVAGRARWDGNLVVAGAVAGAEGEGFGQGVDEFLIEETSDGYGLGGPIADFDAVEGARAAFGEEVGAVRGGGGDEVGEGGEGLPGFWCAVMVLDSVLSWYLSFRRVHDCCDSY